MDKDRIAGAAKQAKGAVKDAAGKVTGDENTGRRQDGQARELQKAIGKGKDAIRDATRR